MASTLLPQGRMGFSGIVNAISILTSSLMRCTSYAFNDFGPKFTCVDPTGEQPLSGMIVSVENVCDLLEFVTLGA
jgi:hypothetical protein